MPQDKFVPKPGEHWIEVALLGNGWAAVEFWMNNEDMYPHGCFKEPFETGLGRYATRDEALAEARSWAMSDDLRLVEPGVMP